MGGDCSSQNAAPVRSLRPSPVVSSLGGDARSGGRNRNTRPSHPRFDNEFSYDFEFEYDLDSLSSLSRPPQQPAATRVNPGKLSHPALASSSSSSTESGCSGNHSFDGYVPTRVLDSWFEGLPQDPADLRPIPESDVWSDGAREDAEWLRTEASYYYQDERTAARDGKGRGSSEYVHYRPSYVLAVGLQSDGEREEDEERRRLQRQREERERQQRQRASPQPAALKGRGKKKTLVSRCA